MTMARPSERRRPAGRRRILAALVLAAAAIGVALSTGCSAQEEGPAAEEAHEAARLDSKIRSLLETRQALELENRVARAGSPYLVVDFPARQIELKARGRLLRAHALEGYAFVATSPPGNDRWDISARKPLREVQRTRVDPGGGEDGEEAPVDISWGPARMPAEFDLICEGGRVLEIRAVPGASSRFIREMQWLCSRLADMARRLRGLSSPAEGGRIRLWLGEGDGRTLYWSLPEKLPLLFRSAPGLAADPPAGGALK